MLQLKNNTPFAAEFAFFPNEKGIDTLYTLVKSSFVMSQKKPARPELIAGSQMPASPELTAGSPVPGRPELVAGQEMPARSELMAGREMPARPELMAGREMSARPEPVEGQTATPANFAPFDSVHGEREVWMVLDEQIPLNKADKYWGEPENSSLRFASDFHTGKAATDIIMIGSACAPQLRPVRMLDVSLAVAERCKTIRVFGNRQWRQGSITTPEPFTLMPLIYERAFGGVDRAGNKVRAAESRNPVGLGFAGEKSEEDMEGQSLPNLECPGQLIQRISDQPTPACFAPIAPHWQPRRNHAGSYDEKWQRERAPYLPEDYHPAFMNAAHRDLLGDNFLRGGEAVSITGMHPSGPLDFHLPYLKLVNKLQVSGEEITTAFSLETLVLDPNQLRVSMVWRAAFECDKKSLKVNQITVSMTR